MVAWYDILRSILEAIVTTHGFKTYSHEAYTQYLRKYYSIELSNRLDRARRLRNKINYYGKKMNIEEARDAIDKIKALIDELMKILEKEL